ncbi:nucleoside-diphosphate-sugar epimerase [Cryobacterium mesophilum]|uniref:NAD-dependent epimerase/dehydratase family protein n=1 Tax=Terrimesophilobacter mesophilus TaxID=433647 RepID=A0A4R8VAW3_9MICO|nr:NAD-dependent epimerase/dehydratase family protein [Terrimesophilobacter mesophilus]MBB5632330.1 nucleoside-diphosphate-sugar epimerase [Terrimesophilobacter mesophilus]TFB79172.1 NAD-dependent epimerase/dehydratase family protein [Terrimesophilobacter mesophilus]
MSLHHVILGGSGVVGRETAAALRAADQNVTVVRRSPDPESGPGAPVVSADLRDLDDAIRAVRGAEVVYLVLGLPYRLAVWRRDWPRVVENVIAAAKVEGAHLVYFDNVYAYGKVDGPMTEDSPIRPSSRKGEIRAALLQQLEVGHERGLELTVARSADFYGPGASTSAFNSMALDPVARGKEPTWLIDATLPHSMTYTPDIGAALAILGTDDRARGKVWHIPTAPALTGEEYLTLATGGGLRHRTISLGTMRLGAPFVAVAREALELSYQNSRPYVFDSSRFESTFSMAATPYEVGIVRALEESRRVASATG